MTPSDLARARARAHMAKEASFMTGVRRIGSGLSTRASALGSRIGSVFRKRPNVSGATQGVRDMLSKDFDRRLRDARVAKIQAAGKGKLLQRLQAKMKPPTGQPAAAAVKKKGMGLGTKLMLGGGLLATGATIGGGMSAAKTRAQQPLAPPEMVPPGY